MPLLLLLACASHRMDALEASNTVLRQEVTYLQAEVAALEVRVERCEDQIEAQALGAPAPSPTPSFEEEQEAGALLTQVHELLKALRGADAKPLLETLTTKYAGTRAGKAAARMLPEVALVGTKATPLEVEKWYQGGAPTSEPKLLMVVFFEAWCPHCKREMPKLEQQYRALKGKGFEVVALTKVTKSSTDEAVAEMLGEYEVTYPAAKELDGNMSKAYAVTGIPAAVLIKDGVIVWRGHPARLETKDLETFLAK